MYQDLSSCHDWPVEKAIVNLPIRWTGNLKCISSNLLNLLEALSKDTSTVSQTLLTSIRLCLYTGCGLDYQKTFFKDKETSRNKHALMQLLKHHTLSRFPS